MRGRKHSQRARSRRHVRLFLLLALLLALYLFFLGPPDRHRSTAPSEPAPENSEVSQPPVNNDDISDASFEAAAHRILSGRRALGDEVDIHLFVVWHSAWQQRRKILHDIHKSFVVLAVAEFDWGPALLDGLWVLYNGKGGWARAGMRKKVQQCGRGAFVAVVVADTQPQYKALPTAHGEDVVNVRMHAKKAQYRRWAGGSGFRVHGTFNVHEANHDVRVLFHAAPLDLLAAARQTRGLVPQYLKDPAPFRTRRAALAPKPNGGWGCAALRLALGAFAHVVVADAATGTRLWTHPVPTVPTETNVPIVPKTVPIVPCGSWPRAVVLHVPRADLWGVAALLRAEPEEPRGDVRVDSAFAVWVEGRRHTVRLAADD